MSFRVLHVLPHIENGGVAEDTLGLIRFLKKNNVDVCVASAGGRLESVLDRLGVVHYQVTLQSKSPWRIWKNSYTLQKLCSQHAIDILHAHSRAPAWSCFLLARRTGMPWVTTFHGIYSARSWIKRLYNSVMVRSSAVIAISSFVCAHIQTVYGQSRWFQKKKIFTIPRTIDGDYFKPLVDGEETQKALRKDYGIEKNKCVLLLPGRFSPVKGHTLLLKALHALNEHKKNFYVLFLGMSSKPSKREVAYITKLKNLVQKFHLERHITFLPFQDDLRTHYTVADICVLPTIKPEGFGRVLGESLAMKTSVLTFDRGPAQEIVPKSAGILVPSSLEGLKQGLCRVLHWSAEEKRKKGTAGRTHVLRHFSEEKTHHHMLKIYTDIRAHKKA